MRVDEARLCKCMHIDDDFSVSLTFGVFDNLWIVRFKDGNARVSGSKINSNDANVKKFDLVRSP